MTHRHKRTSGRELKTLCGKKYNCFNLNVMFYWKDVTCPKCLKLKGKK